MRKVFLQIIFALLTVMAPALYANDDVALEKIVVTSSRMAQHDYKVAGNVTVISKKRIETSNARNIVDLLKEELGIHVSDTSINKTAKLDIRGFGDTAVSNVLILVNDRKVNSIDISGPDLLQIPIESIERIEILRGAGSVLYGDNAVGGVVNIITKKGKGKMSGKAGVSYASYNTTQQDVEFSGSKKDLAYYVYSKYYNTGGYRENSDYLSKDFNARFDYNLYDKLSIDLSTGWHKDDYRLPGGLNDATELKNLGRRGTANPDDFASSKDRYIKLGFDIKPWPQDLEWGNFLVDFSYRNKDSYAWFDYGSSGATATRYSIDTFGLTGKYVFNQALFNREFNFVTGLDYYTTTNDILGSGAGISQSSDDLTISKDEVGAYLYSEYELFPKMFINAGTRYQKAYYTFDQRNAPLTYQQKNPAESVSTVGCKYEYAKGSNVHLSAQQTFRFLATDEWYSTFSGLNTNLKQQTGIQYEAGIKHNLNDITVLNVTPYWIDIRNEIFFDPYTVAFGTNNNYDKTRRVGVEVGQTTNLLTLLQSSALDRLDLFTNYTYQEPKFNGGTYDDKYIPMVPRQEASGGINIGFLGNYNASLVSRYVGSRFAINDTRNETARVKPYTVVDLKLAYKIHSLEIYAGINNLFDQKYSTYVVKSSTPGSNLKDYYPAPEQNFNVGMNLRF